MNNKAKSLEIVLELVDSDKPTFDKCVESAMQMAKWKDEQLGWHDAKKEQPPMDEEVIVLTNTLNGKELSTPRMICFGHIVDKNICVDYDGWNIPGVAYWMYYKEPK
jgi:hypothetical protein